MLYTPSTTCERNRPVSALARAAAASRGDKRRSTHDDDAVPAALGDGRACQALQLQQVVVAEDAHCDVRQPQAQNKRCVVVFVAEHQRARAQQARQHQRVGGEPHAEDDGRLDAEEVRRGALQLPQQRRVAQLGARRAHGQSVALRRRRRLAARVLAEAQVVVRAQVDAAHLAPREAATSRALTRCAGA